MATLELVEKALGESFADRVSCFGSKERTLKLLNGIEVEQRPLGELALLERKPTLVLHYAFLTKDRAEAMAEDAYRKANVAIGRSVLHSLDRIGAEGIFVASSGAAEFADDPESSPAMRLYGELKKHGEQLFAGWAETSAKSAVISRIFNLSGPHMNKHTSYALASFIVDALSGRPIEVRAARPVIRGYVAIRELLSLVFALLLDLKPGVTRFDTGGKPMEMQEIAEAVASACGGIAVSRPEIRPGAADEYVGDGATYSRLLAEYGVEPVSFAQQVAETASFFEVMAVSGWLHQDHHASRGPASSRPEIGATTTTAQCEATGDRVRNLSE